MYHLPRTLSDDRRDAFEAAFDEMDRRLESEVAAVLGHLDDPALARQLEALAFRSNDVLPKRDARPGMATVVLGLLVEALSESYDDTAAPRGGLLRIALLTMEYYDVVDDLIDGDVAPGGRAEVQATLQLLVSSLVGHLAPLGEEPTAYWADRTVVIADAFLGELVAEPSWETYQLLLESQAALWGSVTGTAAVAARADPADRERAERVGRLCFKLCQCLLDGEQVGDDDPWNAFDLIDDEVVLGSLRSWREDLRCDLETLPAEPADRIDAIVAVDLETWHASVRAPSQ